MRLRRSLLIVSVTLLWAGFRVPAQELPRLQPLPLNEGIAALSFSNLPMSLCPGDEQWLAYQLIDMRRVMKRAGKYADLSPTGVPSLGAGGDIWLSNTRTGESRNLTNGKGSNWALSWSPNGKFLAFYSDRDGRAAIWLWDKAANQLRRVSRAIPRPFIYGYDTPNWTPDSRYLLVKVFPDDATFERLVSDNDDAQSANNVHVRIFQSTNDPSRADTPATPRSDALTAEEVSDFKADFALLDIINGALTTVSQGHAPAGYQLSPDGGKLAFLESKGVDAKGQPTFDLVVVSLPDQKTTVLASDLVQGSLGDRFTWSPNRDLIGYLSGSEWYLISTAGGAPRKVTDATHPPFKAWEQLPLWSSDGKWLHFLTNNGLWRVATENGQVQQVGHLEGKRLQFLASNGKGSLLTFDRGLSVVLAVRDDQTKQSGFYTMSLADGRAQPLLFGNKEIRRVPWVTASSKSDLIYYVDQDSSQATDIWSMSVSGNTTPKRLTRTNPVFDEYVTGEGQLIEWRSSDGASLRGALMLPAGYKKGERYPLIVNVYGGSNLSDRVNLFGFTANTITNQQFWATRGYAVLLPDSSLRVGTPMLDLAKTILPAVDRIIDMGIADPERIGVWGSSYGGYSTLSLLVQTNRFKAAAIDSGFANLMTLYGWMPERSNDPSWQDWAEGSLGRMGGSPWKYRERYLENSPVFYLDRVKTPLLIIQGTEDPSGKDVYSNEIFMNLRRLGKEATYLKYRGASHTISSFTYSEQVDVMQRLLTWFDSHLKNQQQESR